MGSLTAADRDLMARYRSAKDRWEALVAEHATATMNGIGMETVSELRERRDTAESELDQMKEAGGEAQPGDPVCCQRYGLLHLPVFSVAGCRWLPLDDHEREAS